MANFNQEGQIVGVQINNGALPVSEIKAMYDNDAMGIPYETTAAEKLRTRAKTELTVTLPDTRGVTVNRWMKGNLKLGPNVWTYSRLPGRPTPHGGTCPGATPECMSICYAFRIGGLVKSVYEENSATSVVPALPEGAKFVRLHVSGDFDSMPYILSWLRLVNANPTVKFWAYTRSWRVPELLPYLELLRECPNFQMFASLDGSDDKMPPEGWRRSWLNTDQRSKWFVEGTNQNFTYLEIDEWDDPIDLEPRMRNVSYVCPEETRRRPSCEACGYCFLGQKGDVTFIVH